MARQLLISDEEERFLRELLDANLRGLRAQKVYTGETPGNSKFTALVGGVLRKLGVEVPEDGGQDHGDALPVAPVPDPGFDIEVMSKQIQHSMRGAIPTRIERIAAPIFTRLVSDLICSRMGRDTAEISKFEARDAARTAVDLAFDFFEVHDARIDE